MNMIKIGVGQANFKVGDRQGNLKLIALLLHEAEQARVDLLVLPELANSGYTFNSREEAEAVAEIVGEGPVCQMLQGWSAPDRMVVSGLCEKGADALYNSAVVYSGGELETVYHKIHLFAKEKLWFRAGNEPAPVFSFRGCQLGVMICFDWIFPEMARSLALRGAQAILHPANLVLPFCQKAMVTRSLENRVFTATANRCGTDRELSFSGLSQVTAPNGSVLTQAGANFQGVVYADVDLAAADNKWITPQNHVLQDRHPELYD